MLNAMRSHAGGLAAKILLGLLILSFAVWGVEDMLRNHGSAGPLATVGGHEIPRAAFAQEYRQEANRTRARCGVMILGESDPNIRTFAPWADETLLRPVDAAYVANRARAYCTC
jgi:hypothetical protein